MVAQLSIEDVPKLRLCLGMLRIVRQVREAGVSVLYREQLLLRTLSEGKIESRPIPVEIRKKYLGGRGLDAYLLNNHAPKGCDPLGPENPLLISGGILTATCASATARTHIMPK